MTPLNFSVNNLPSYFPLSKQLYVYTNPVHLALSRWIFWVLGSNVPQDSCPSTYLQAVSAAGWQKWWLNSLLSVRETESVIVHLRTYLAKKQVRNENHQKTVPVSWHSRRPRQLGQSSSHFKGQLTLCQYKIPEAPLVAQFCYLVSPLCNQAWTLCITPRLVSSFPSV